MAAAGTRLNPARLRSGVARRASLSYGRFRDQVERRAGRAPWPQHVLLILGMPKSGTTWLAELLQRMPRYRWRPFRDPDGCVARHDICDDVFASLPLDLYSVLKLHTVASPRNLAVLDRFSLPAVVMHRDLRDQAVSRYFHVKLDATHRHYELYNRVSSDEGLAHSIDVSTSEYREWIEGWLPLLAAAPDRFHELRYETLRADPVAALTATLSFYGIALSESHISRIVDEVAANTSFDLAASLRRNQTARAGIVGGWRKHFNEEHVARFKERAGDLLVSLGYERDRDWSL